jgi:YesN/AraC family two-component response regulator
MLQELKEMVQKLKRLNALFVDDERIVLDAMRGVMPTLYNNVYFAQNGYDGLSLAIRHKVDMVITDISMPKMSGIEMVRSIQEINPNVKVIYITGHSFEDFHIIPHENYELLVKPISTKKLFSAIENLL